jgi:hypothetical protein
MVNKKTNEIKLQSGLSGRLVGSKSEAKPEATSLFDVQRSMFDIRRSSFKTIPHGINVTRNPQPVSRNP